MPDLLIELLSEEIPARMQRAAAGQLKKRVTDALVDAGLSYEGAKAHWTPRRLALDIRGLTPRSADIREERKGPRVDAPAKAVEGFMRGAGLSRIEDAEIRSDPKKGDFYVAIVEKPGREAEAVIAQALPDVIRDFDWPKSMRWGESSRETGALRWVRPLQSILCTYGPETEDTVIVDFDINGIHSSDQTVGHRFMAPSYFSAKRYDDYVAKLKEARVVLDPEQRREIIAADAENLAFAQGLDLVEDEGLLEETANLVEWPVVIMGEFDERFLSIPDEVIRLTIRENQKCFVLKSRNDGALVNRFILVANIEASDGGDEIARGNAKVVNARLADAKFFWESDLQVARSSRGFESWIDDLANVTFHARLGTQGDRVARIAALGSDIAPIVGADPQMVVRAARLAKADLQSQMVYEFPELQGHMGCLYAKQAGENEMVAAAIEDHYKPLGPSDEVPNEPVSVAVALADKLDMLAGFWAIDEKPTGSKDPYALRRAALGIIRLVLDNEVRLALGEYAIAAIARFEGGDNKAVVDLLAFFHDRLKVWLRDQGARHDLIDAVVTPKSDDILIIVEKVRALQKLIESEDGVNLLAGYKRAANILAAEEKKGTVISDVVSVDRFETDAERALHETLEDVENLAAIAVAEENFEAAMTRMATLRAPIDNFFESVLVNAEDETVRANRLALLARIRAVTGTIADFSKIAG